MNNVLDSIASCDVIEPLTLAVYQAASGGGWVRLEWDRASGWSGVEVERELRRFSIPVHGRGFTPVTKEWPAGTLFCYVKRGQARWAEYVLRRAGVPVLTVIDARNEVWAEGKGPVLAWDERGKRAATSPTRKRGLTPLADLVTRGKRKRGTLGRLVDWLLNG